jgi:hypothetical protein
MAKGWLTPLTNSPAGAGGLAKAAKAIELRTRVRTVCVALEKIFIE